MYFQLLSSYFNDEVSFLYTEDDVPVAWNKPIGVLYDLMQGTSPWRLSCGTKADEYPEYILPLADVESYWCNQMKEACYIHNGNSKQMMSLSRDDSLTFWHSVVTHNQTTWFRMFAKLHLQFKRIPIRLYLNDSKLDKVVQWHGQTLGEAMCELIPELFDMKRWRNNDQVSVVLHGVEPPLQCPVDDLYRECVYVDGFLHLCVIVKPNLSDAESRAEGES